MAERMQRPTVSHPTDQDRGPARNPAITHTLAQFVVTALIVLAILVLLVQWNTIEVGDGEMPGPVLAAGAVAHRGSERAQALVSRLTAERESDEWKTPHRGHVTRRGLASLLIEIHRNSGGAR